MANKWWTNTDNDLSVTRGGSVSSQIECMEIIHANDGYGGFNVKFIATNPPDGPVAEYHIHFKGALPGGRDNKYAGSKDGLPGKVKVLKIKNLGGNGPEYDQNIYKDEDGTSNLADMAKECQAYPNTKRLCENLSTAYKDWKKT